MGEKARDTTLVIGASGLLGPYLMRSLARLGPVIGLSRHGPDVACDCRDASALRRVLDEVRPRVVIYAVALTDVDRCEREPALADALNRGGAQHLVDAIGDDVKPVYVSTDQVYPDAGSPHAEPGVGPINVYGRSKLAGEGAVLGHPRALIPRTNLFGPSLTPGRQSLSDYMLERLRLGAELNLFSDSYFSPLHMATLSLIIAELIELDAAGVFNLGSREGMSKMEFGYLLARRFGLSTGHTVQVESSMFAGRAPRPRDMRMDVSRLEQLLGRRLPTLVEEVNKL